MHVCPQCEVEVEDSESRCPSCGAELNLTSDPTAVQGPDHTPTKIKKTEAERHVHTTSSGSGARFVAGHVLAGRYRIIGLIGKGGMGEVYKAEDLELDQTVALKFLPEKFSEEEDLLKRFRSEVRTARQVSHPNVCRVFDIGETDELYYITMEFIEGDDLSILLGRIGRLPSEKAVEISRQICLGLGAIHKAGILHRDLKPANIIIDQNGEARITDFGIAGIEAEVQGEEARVGTPAYMSPEQITGKEVTKRSDIYSLGLLLYEIFTGKQAFSGASVQELKEKHTKDTPTNPSELVTGIDPVVEDLIEKCLKKDPDERPDSALKVAMMLPGGDPLQVALEAGETPTPEMVAAAPEKGSLSRLAGLALFLGYAVFIVAGIYWHADLLNVALEPVNRSREVLADRAKEISRKLGYTETPADDAHGFDIERDVLEFANNRKDPEAFWQKFRKGRPSIVRFDYRQSPRLLIPEDENGPVTEEDPGLTVPGMIRIELDPKGRLLKFTAVPRAKPVEPGVAAETDWETVFREAGLEIAKFEPAKPSSATIYNYDELRAWQGTLPEDPGIPITVEGTALGGRPVSFEIFGPWNTPMENKGSARGSQSDNPASVFFLLLTIIIAVGAVLLSRYNLKNGRGDLKGALKVAGIIFVFTVLTQFIFTEKIGALGPDVTRLFVLLSYAPFPSLMGFIAYLAIEPLLRKWFPEMFVSWSRLLAGNFRNHLVGRDLLTGMFIGGAVALSSILVTVLLSPFTTNTYLPGDLFSNTSVTPLYGEGLVFGLLLSGVVNALVGSFMFLFVYLVFFLITRKRWIAAGLFFVLVSVPAGLEVYQNGSIVSVVGPVFFFGSLIFCYLRFGFLTSVGLGIALPTFEIFTFDPEKFFFPGTLLTIGFLLTIAFIAFLIATKGQPWISRDLLE